jgi:hypothetical protein
MASTETSDQDTAGELRREIEREREQLAQAVASLRNASDLNGWLRPKMPILAAAAFCTTFLLAGGIGALIRLLLRRGREGHELARLGQLALVRRD